jgi:CheY-like chemotaxis protein
MARAILIVEDDPMMRRTLVRVFRAHRPIVDVDSAEQALALVASGERFAAMLCDLTLPGLSGIDLFNRLRVLAPEQAARFVALTGGVLDTLDADFVRWLGGRLLFKPIETDRLIAVVLGVAEADARRRRGDETPQLKRLALLCAARSA